VGNLVGYGDIPMTVQAMKGGAIEFLTKPSRDQDLLDAVNRGIESDRAARSQRATMEGLRARHETLTPRENQVMTLVVSGILNKQVADELGTTEKTGRGRIGYNGKNYQGSSRSHHAEDAGEISR
jgi:FixJ family two-component response regulator